MNQSGSRLTRYALEVLDMMKKRVDQSAVPVTGSGMYNKPGRFVDHDDLVIFMYDIERDILWIEMEPFRIGNDSLDLIAFARFV
jgi:hypothetical protein